MDELVVLNKDYERLEQVGLTLDEGKTLLLKIQLLIARGDTTGLVDLCDDSYFDGLDRAEFAYMRCIRARAERQSCKYHRTRISSPIARS